MRSMFGHAACVGLLLITVPAAAQAGDRAAAEALFQKARDAMASADYDTACSAFEESNRMDPAPGTMVNLAGCEEKRGHLASAWQWFEQSAAKLAQDDPRREFVVGRAAELKARLPLLTVRLAPGAPADSKVVRDSVELRSASLGLALPIDPGAHRIVVSAAGRAEKRYAVALVEKEQKDLVVEPGPPLSAPEQAAPPPAAPAAAGPSEAAPDTGVRSAPSGGSTRTLGYVVGGVGVAGIGTALVVGGLVLGKKGTVADHCSSASRSCDQEGLDAVSSGATLSTVSTVSFVIGAVATGVGVYFIVTSKDEPKTTVGAVGAPGGGFLRVATEF